MRGLGIKGGIQGVFIGAARIGPYPPDRAPSDGAKRSAKIVLKVVTTENYSGVGKHRRIRVCSACSPGTHPSQATSGVGRLPGVS